MADVKLDLDDDPGVKVLLSQLRRDPPGMPTDNRLVQSLKNTGIPYLAISAIGNALSGSSIRVKVRDRDGDGIPDGPPIRKSNPQSNPEQRDDELREAPASHPLCKLFEYINPNDTFEDLAMDIVLQYCLTGTAALWFVPSRLGNPCEMYVLPTALMFAQAITPQYPEGAWRIQQYFPAGAYGMLPTPQSGSGVLIDGRQIKRFRMRHPLWRWDGYSPFTAGGVQLDVLNAIDESRKSAMDHGFNPDAVVSVEGANQESLQRAKAEMENRHGGSRNARKVVWVNGKGVSFDSMSTNPKEMDYASGWDQMVKYALGLFGVPPGTAGIAEATSYAQLYASLRQFYTLKLQPLAKSLGSFLTKHVAKDVDPNAVIQVDVPEIDDKEMTEKMLAADVAANAITLNEYRGKRSMAPMPDGDRMIGDPSPGQQAADAAANQDPNAPQEGEPQTPEDAVTHSVLGMLGVDPNEAGGDEPGMVPGGQPAVMKRLAWDENKHKRDRGRFSSTGGSGKAPKQPVGKRATVTGSTPGNVAKPVKQVPFAQPLKQPDSTMPGGSIGVVGSWAERMFQPVAGLIDHFNKLDSALSNPETWKKAIKFPAQAVQAVRDAIAKMTEKGISTDQLIRSHDWAVQAAKKHAPKFAAKEGKDPAKCERALFYMFQSMAHQAIKTGQTQSMPSKIGRFDLSAKNINGPKQNKPAVRPQPTGPLPYPNRKPGSMQRSDLSALFKSQPELAEIIKAL